MPKKKQNKVKDFFIQETQEGARFPLWHGFAWYNCNCLTKISIILPFNILIRGLRIFWLKLKRNKWWIKGINCNQQYARMETFKEQSGKYLAMVKLNKSGDLELLFSESKVKCKNPAKIIISNET